ncbi:hypothetical protein [Chloroflexus aggregans]|uniref:Helicase n=1 Tax=Chloroflexus aggregans (strain MD-66 / DSM 9485) TaxID=326427 RepID=B8G612_CHLAD|nr:hypothetical protein [Chloroflexus aggregans]ACL25745.1 helicase [Chloroflexus aggregans DSM 9485]
MSDFIEILQMLAERSGRKPSPLIALHHVPGRAGVRISHLTIAPALKDAWLDVVGLPFFQAQSTALAALRRGTAFAITGTGMLSRASLHLLVLDLLHHEPSATALLIAADPDQALLHEREATALAHSLRPPIAITATNGSNRRIAPTSRLVITTLPELHSSLLRFHDRAWRYFWSRLRMIAIPDLHTYYGIAAGHLSMALLRATRLAPHPPLLGGSVAPVSGAETALQLLSGQEWRITPVADLPHPATTLALWQSDGDRQREIMRLADALVTAGANVRLVANRFEIGTLRAFAKDALSVGTTPLPAHVQIVTGADNGTVQLSAALSSEAMLVILLLGRGISEPALQRLAVTDLATWPLLQPPVWPPAPTNSFVTALHLVCAANEQPLRQQEIQQWQLTPTVERLEARRYLQRLPHQPPLWLPGTQIDPYIPLDLHAAGTDPLFLLDEQGQPIGTADPSIAGRWAFVGAALPPLRGDQRVIAWDEEQATVQLVADSGRRTVPLRRCRVHIHNEWGQRELRRKQSGHGPRLAWGRVMIEETTYAYREYNSRNTVQERTLSEPFTSQWYSPAVWIQLNRPLNVTGQLVGWSCAAAIAVQTLARLEDCVPAYDPDNNYLYLIDAQPNGNGLAAWLYEQLETILPLAYDIALDQRLDPLFEPLARADMDWLLAVLGGEVDMTIALPPWAQSSPTRSTNPPTRTPDPPTRASDPPTHTPDPPTRASDPPTRTPDPPIHAPNPPTRASDPPTHTPDPPTRTPDPPVRAEPLRPNRATGHTRNRHSRPPDRVPPRSNAHQPQSLTRVEPETPPAAPSEEPTVPDAEAILARLRQRRSRLETETPRRSEAPASGNSTFEPRFHPGERIICMPYGAGKVRLSLVNGDREILIVDFDEHGELRIDPSVSVVRRLPPEERHDRVEE